MLGPVNDPAAAAKATGETATQAIGKVWLVGAGPGDPGLITVLGSTLLRAADVVLYDALSHPALLAHCPQAELRNVGKRGGSYSPDQDWITKQLIELARSGKRVVRLKGGDSFLFARGAEEAEALARANIPFEVVPGLSSPVGTSAYAGISLTHRDLSSSVTFITGSDRAGKQWSADAWKKLATATDTICVLMGMRQLPQIAEALIAGGRSSTTPVAVVQWGARPNQRVAVATLATVAEEARRSGLTNPAVIIIGEVVGLRQVMNWFEEKPLFGRRILVPRPVHQAAATAEAIRARGAEPVCFPVIEIVDPPEPQRLTEAVNNLAKYGWVLFTSANGVDRFFAEVGRLGLDARALGGCRVGAIGPRTAAALEPFGIQPDLVAKEFIGEGLARAVLGHETTRTSAPVLIPRALVAREELPNLLRDAGLQVDVVPAYETRPIGTEQAAQLQKLLVSGEVDTIAFTSSSTVTSTVTALGQHATESLSEVQVASIGPITSRTAAEHQLSVAVTAETYTVAGLLDALERDAVQDDVAQGDAV